MRNKKQFRRNASAFAKANNIPYRLTKKLLGTKGAACENALAEIVMRQMQIDAKQIFNRHRESQARAIRAMLRQPFKGELQGLWGKLFKTA